MKNQNRSGTGGYCRGFGVSAWETVRPLTRYFMNVQTTATAHDSNGGKSVPKRLQRLNLRVCIAEPLNHELDKLLTSHALAITMLRHDRLDFLWLDVLSDRLQYMFGDRRGWENVQCALSWVAIKCI
jgi:hypothetical protein